MTGVRYRNAMRVASIAAKKQSDGLLAATIGQRRLGVPAVHRHQQVGGLGLRRQAGRRSTALDVDDHQRQLEADREAHRLGLQAPSRARSSSYSRGAPERRAQRGADAGDLVLSLQRADAEVLVLARAREGCRRQA